MKHGIAGAAFARTALIVLAASALASVPRAVRAAETGVVDGFIEGVALGLHFSEGQDYSPYLWEIAQTGANTVSLVFHWTVGDVRDSSVAPADDAPSAAALGAAVDSAHRLGLAVMLFPIVQLETRAPGDWRGVLAPEDTEAWFRSYTALLVGCAEVAERHGVEVLSVGSELASIEGREAEWRTAIDEVRAVYRGRVLYSANWDAYFATPFWDAVDLVGLTGYFELSDAEGVNPSADTLADAWSPFVEALRSFARGIGKPVVITELGYVSQPGAAYHPWDYTTGNGVDVQAQAELYQAAYDVLHDEAWLAGLFVWNWFGDGGSGDDGYTPRHKPAEEVVRHWYGGAPSGAR